MRDCSESEFSSSSSSSDFGESGEEENEEESGEHSHMEDVESKDKKEEHKAIEKDKADEINRKGPSIPQAESDFLKALQNHTDDDEFDIYLDK